LNIAPATQPIDKIRFNANAGPARTIKPQTSQLPPLPLSLPSNNDWLLKIIAIQGRFVLGVYRRQMKAIGYLGKIEKQLGVPVTTRNWNTIEKVAKILRPDSKEF
jgi:hypothetical protein